MIYHASFVIFEKVAKYEIVICCTALYGLSTSTKCVVIRACARPFVVSV